MTADTTNDNSWGLVLSFTGLDFGETTEHAFVHGVEFGQILQRMLESREAEIEQLIHTINCTAIERACAAQGWSAEFRDMADGYTTAVLRKTSAARPNPHGLRVVN